MLVKLKLVAAFVITSRAALWSLGLLKELVLMFNMLHFSQLSPNLIVGHICHIYYAL